MDPLQQQISFELMKELKHVFVYHHLIITTKDLILLYFFSFICLIKNNKLEFVPLILDEIFEILVQQ